MSVIKLFDQKELVPCSCYPYAKFPFEYFNQVQSRVFDFYDKDCNAVIAANTSSGKTVSAEMFLSHEINKRGGKGVYLSPLKALSQEKFDDWNEKDHHFHNNKISICTGDYLLTPKRKEELNESNIIVMSSEMLNSKGRHNNAEFLNNVGTLVVDESHLLTVPGRGDHLESGLMKYSKLNPNGRIVLLSATMPNVGQISEWIASLTNKDTYFIESSYRPCPLNIHYIPYDDSHYSYEQKEEEKVYEALKIIDKNNDDKFLVFGHTKKIIALMHEKLKKAGYNCAIHTADLSKDTRKQVEQRFKTDKKLQIIVATSSMAWGVNCPARRVIILGITRGLQEVATYDINQMCGRSGRPQYDPQGDAYILLPESAMAFQLQRLKKPQRIESQIFDPKNVRCHKVLAFHLVSEINNSYVTNREGVKDWYEDTLANFQNQELKSHVVENALTELLRCGSIKEEEKVLRATGIGKIASMFYYSPFDVSDLCNNFTKVFKEKKEKDDYWVSFALAWTDSHRCNIVSNAEKDAIEGYKNRLTSTKAISINNGWMSEGAVKIGYAYFCLLNGTFNISLAAIISGLKIDFGRVKQVLQVIDAMVGKWDKNDYFIELEKRILSGVPRHLLDVCQIKGIGKVKGQRLADYGLNTIDKIANSQLKPVMMAINCTENVAQSIILTAKDLLQK